MLSALLSIDKMPAGVGRKDSKNLPSDALKKCAYMV